MNNFLAGTRIGTVFLDKALLLKRSDAIEQSPCPVLLIGSDGIVEFANNRFLSQAGLSKSEAKGRPLEQLYGWEEQDISFADLWGKVLKGECWVGPLPIRRKD